MTDNKIRHILLEEYIQNTKNQGKKLGEEMPIEYLISLYHVNDEDGGYRNEEYEIKRSKMLNYLLASGYFTFIKKEGNTHRFVSITRKGVDAYNGEFFLQLDKKDKKEKLNNRYTIAFGFITAIGVLFAIWKDSFKEPVNNIIIINSKDVIKTVDSLGKMK